MRRIVAIVSGLVVAGATIATVPAAASPGARSSARATAAADRWASRANAASTKAFAGAGLRIDEFADILPAGHLGGRKTPDVLDERQTGLPGSNHTFGVTARVGTTGRALWSKTYAESSDNFVGVQPEPVGANGKTGLIVIQTSSTPGTGTLVDDDLTITALSGTDGSVLWSQSFDGFEDTSTGDLNVVPQFAAPFRDATSRTLDYFVPTETTLGGGDEQTGSEVVSGINGAVHAFGGTFTSMQGFPQEAVVPDVNGDGLNDVYIFVPSSPSFVTLESGADADQLWSTDFNGTNPNLAVLPRYSHRHSPDLVLSMPATDGFTAFTVLEGSSGDVLWTRNGDRLLGIERAGTHLKRAVLICRFTQSSTPSLITSRLTYTAVTPANTVIYHKHISVSVKPLTGDSASLSGGGVGVIGDVEPDGALDVMAVNSASSDAPPKQRSATQTGIIDSRTGAFHPVAVQNAADGSLHRGKATDLLAARVLKGRPTVLGWRGINQHRYYRRTLKVISSALGAWVEGIRVSGHHCSDITLSAGTATRGLTGVLSARGQPLWTIDFKTSHAIGGTLHRHKRPKHFCV